MKEKNQSYIFLNQEGPSFYSILPLFFLGGVAFQLIT